MKSGAPKVDVDYKSDNKPGSSPLSLSIVVDAKLIASEEGSINKAFEYKHEGATYVAKYIASPAVRFAEVVGQEFIRLIIPELVAQPRYYSFVDQNNKSGVMSEKVLNYTPLTLDALIKQKACPTIPHLGSTLLVCMFCDETDLKLDHIDATTGVKIDGDWMFSSLTNSMLRQHSGITPGNIALLPYVDQKSSNAKQWLDLFCQQKGRKLNRFFLPLSNDATFREQINEAIIRILMLPPSVFNAFLSSYVDDQAIKGKMLEFMLTRQSQLQMAVVNDSNFMKWLNLKKQNPYQWIAAFDTAFGKKLFADTEYAQLKIDIERRRVELSQLMHKQAASPSAAGVFSPGGNKHKHANKADVNPNNKVKKIPHK